MSALFSKNRTVKTTVLFDKNLDNTDNVKELDVFNAVNEVIPFIRVKAKPIEWRLMEGFSDRGSNEFSWILRPNNILHEFFEVWYTGNDKGEIIDRYLYTKFGKFSSVKDYKHFAQNRLNDLLNNIQEVLSKPVEWVLVKKIHNNITRWHIYQIKGLNYFKNSGAIYYFPDSNTVPKNPYGVNRCFSLHYIIDLHPDFETAKSESIKHLKEVLNNLIETTNNP